MNNPPPKNPVGSSDGESTTADRVRRILHEHLPGYEMQTISVLNSDRPGTPELIVTVDGSLIVVLPGVEHDAPQGLSPSVEATLIRSLGGLLDVPVPVPVLQDDELWVRAHRKLPGRTLADLVELDAGRSIRLGRRLGGALADLHGVDASDTGVNLPIAPGPEWYRASASRHWAAHSAVEAQLQDSTLQATVARFLHQPAPDHPPHPSLGHLDLRPANILLDGPHQELSGIAGWSRAAIGDPAKDLGSVLLHLGPEALDAALDGYRRAGAVTDDDPELLVRIVFHARCAAIEDLDSAVARSVGLW